MTCSAAALKFDASSSIRIGLPEHPTHRKRLAWPMIPILIIRLAHQVPLVTERQMICIASARDDSARDELTAKGNQSPSETSANSSLDNGFDGWGRAHHFASATKSN